MRIASASPMSILVTYNYNTNNFPWSRQQASVTTKADEIRTRGSVAGEGQSVMIGGTPGGGGHPLDLHALTPGTLSTGLKRAYLFSTFVIKIEVEICFP